MSSAYSKEKPKADLKAEYQKFIGRKMLFFILSHPGYNYIGRLCSHARLGGTSASWMSMLLSWRSSYPALSRPHGSPTPSFGDCGCIESFWPS